MKNKSETPKEGVIDAEGEVVETLPNAMFRVALSNGHIVLCTISGKLRMNFIKILTGDKVKLQISSYDLNRGRIIWRDKGPSSRTDVNKPN